MARNLDDVLIDVMNLVPLKLYQELLVAIEEDLADSMEGSEEVLNNTLDSEC